MYTLAGQWVADKSPNRHFPGPSQTLPKVKTMTDKSKDDMPGAKTLYENGHRGDGAEIVCSKFNYWYQEKKDWGSINAYNPFWHELTSRCVSHLDGFCCHRKGFLVVRFPEAEVGFRISN